MSRKHKGPKFDGREIPITPVGNLTDQQRIEKAMARARELHPAIVVAWLAIEGTCIGWVQSTLHLDRWSFLSITPRKYSRLSTPSHYLIQILPEWAQRAEIVSLWVQPIDLRSKAEIARDRKCQV